MSSTGGAITKQAFGRHGFIGSLYDIRSDRFEGGNLFNRPLESSMILTADSASSDYIVDENISQKDTFNKLNIEASMKLSLMAGLIQLEGSAKYLNQTKTDSRTVRVTFMLNLKTKQEHLQISRADLYQYFSSDALENRNATHCVISIIWGARVAATFEEIMTNSEAAEELQGRLAVSLKKVAIQVSGEASLEHNNKGNAKFESLKISFSGDILIQDIPHTIEDVFNIFKKVPTLLENLNDGKGQQLEFELYPLERMAEIFKHELRIERMIKEVTNSVVNRIENIFEQIIQGKRMMNDFLSTIEPWKNWICSNWIEVIYDRQKHLAGIELETQRRLASLLESIRRGEADEKVMVELLDRFEQENPCSVMSVKKFLQSNARIGTKIESLSEFDQHVLDGAHEKTSKIPNPTILLKTFRSIDDFIQKHYDDNTYLLHISNTWEEQDKANWYKQLRCFKYLYKLGKKDEAKKDIFCVIDHDLHVGLDQKPNSCVIYHAYRGTITTKDYYQSSLIQLSWQQIQDIRVENKFSTLSNTDIEKWHKEFIESHPNGEMNEKQWIDEFQKLYPNGDPRYFCHIAFSIIDKNHNGLISFTEFMSAISLTLPSNMQQKLTLIFAICAHDKDEVDKNELIEFLEAVNQLESRTESSGGSGTNLIVNNIMKFLKRKSNEKIMREEFINCLKANYEWCRAFLPVSPKLPNSLHHQSDENLTKSPCRWKSQCRLRTDHSHCDHFYHPGDQQHESHQQGSASRTPCEWGSDCNDQRHEHRANFSHPHDDKRQDQKRKRCFYGVNCLKQFSDKGHHHNLKYSHPCRFAELCGHPEEHLTHEPQQVSNCKYDKSCRNLGDPMHRSKYRHTDLPYFLIPCQDQDKCHDTSNEHRSEYSHGEEVFETNARTEDSNRDRLTQCKWGSQCRHITDADHCRMYSHLSDNQHRNDRLVPCQWKGKCHDHSSYHRAKFSHPST
ncbi:unnamed protein product [Rotaria socialis]|uniref:EF-hand domain-containing protein n=1 Tax=Rotaria socialis TaxID=392032 RepID=A0A820EIP2_9BILA|nr:unnamed protein product [Rotaria socialis]CAF4249175.1 unnamed protein product [Rotaria socialis]